jgi:hypothetical protein
MAMDFHAIPREVWLGFVDGGGLDRVEPLRYFKPLLTVRLAPATAQEEADNQRQRFKRLIVELFPLDRVEAFIAALLDAGMYPRLQASDFDAGLMLPLEKMLVHEAEPLPAPFDLEAGRMGPYNKPRLDASEYGYAIRLLQLRPGLALTTLFLRGFLVLWARALKWEASRSSLNAEHSASFEFFCNSWYQAPLISILYPSIGLHLRPRIELRGKRIDEPNFTRPLMIEVMSWLTEKGFFAQEARVEWSGYQAKLSCSATAFLHQALGKRGLLNAIFDKVVQDQRIPLMSTYLEQVVLRGNALSAVR